MHNGYSLIVFIFANEIDVVLPKKNVIYVSLGKENKSFTDLVTNKEQSSLVKRENVFYLNNDPGKIKDIISTRI